MEPDKLSTIFSQLKHFQSQIPQADKVHYLKMTIANEYDRIIDDLNALVDEDCSRYKIKTEDTYILNESLGNATVCDTISLRTKLGSVIGLVESKLGKPLQENNKTTGMIIQVLNNNTNALAVTIEQTIVQISEQEENPELKTKLQELEEALKENNKNKIKDLLIFLLEKSFELAIKILPEVLKRYII